MTKTSNGIAIALALVVCAGQAGWAETGAGAAAVKSRAVGAQGDLNQLLIVKVSDGAAIIRFGAGAPEKVSVGDRVGKSKAAITEIGAGRIVLEETFTGADGRPNRALIIIKEGERGGTRYLQRPETPPMVGVKTGVVKPPEPKKP